MTDDRAFPDREAIARVIENHSHGGIRQLYGKTSCGEVFASAVGAECYCGRAYSGSDEHCVRADWTEHVADAILALSPSNATAQARREGYAQAREDAARVADETGDVHERSFDTAPDKSSRERCAARTRVSRYIAEDIRSLPDPEGDA